MATTSYVCDLDLIGSEMERPYARVYAQGETPDEALAVARQNLAADESLRDVAHPLQDILADVLARPDDWTISWKHEGRFGPVVLTDRTKLPADGRIAIPFGTDPEWSVSLPWSSRAEAKRLAVYLGLPLEEA